MLKIATLGVMLFATHSCVTLDKTMMYAINTDYQEAGVATVNLNIRSDAKRVGEWNYTPDFLTFLDIPKNLRCFSEETYQTLIKPRLKEASRAYHDQEN